MSSTNNNKPVFDLGGFLEIQKNILLGIDESNVSTDINLDEINNQLGKLSEGTDNAQDRAQQLLTQQESVSTILKKDHAALKTANANLQDDKIGVQRVNLLEDSKRKRLQEYNKMAMIIIIMAVLVFGIINLQDMFPFFPTWIFSILIIIIGTISIIQVGKIYYNVLSRSPTNFDQLMFSPPKIDSPEEIVKKQLESTKKGDLTGSIVGKTCYGSLCCDVGTIWDNDKLKCTEGFSCANRKTESFLTNTPNEYEHYMKV